MNLISYAPTAFSSARLPGLAAASSGSKPLKRGGWRMPWGNTRQVVPDFLMSPSPTELRREVLEEHDRMINPGEGVLKVQAEFHNHLTHEYLRFAPYALSSRLLRGIKLWSKLAFWFLAVMGLWVTITGTWNAEEERLRTFLAFFLFTVVLTFPSLVGWGVSAFLLSRFFACLIRPTRGPAWELSRRTGMVTLFKYRGKQVLTHSAPFHEFDAYIRTRRGNHEFWLEHRYSNAAISFLPICGPRPCFVSLWALWDFLQNYMDTSQPLPDVPGLERYRGNDPTTVKHDGETGRDPRCWVDMDDESFWQARVSMEESVEALDTDSRPDLMARYVKFS